MVLIVEILEGNDKSGAGDRAASGSAGSGSGDHSGTLRDRDGDESAAVATDAALGCVLALVAALAMSGYFTALRCVSVFLVFVYWERKYSNAIYLSATS
jgi:hypothetical protein